MNLRLFAIFLTISILATFVASVVVEVENAPFFDDACSKGQPWPIDTSCPLPKPSTGFWCHSSRWILNTSFVGDALVIPAYSTVFICGNMTTSKIVINGLDTSLHIRGCLVRASGSTSNTTSIKVILSDKNVDDIDKSDVSSNLLYTYGDNCVYQTPSLTTSDPNGCRGIVVVTRRIPGSTIGVFSINSGYCTLLLTVSSLMILVGSVGMFIILLSMYKIRQFKCCNHKVTDVDSQVTP